MRKRAFTIVELLVVMAVIIVLLGLITIAIGKASKTSQSAQTRALMNSLKQALVRFEGDVGYLPPVLDAQRELFDPWSGVFDPQLWFSETTLAEYLVGYDEGRYDGYGSGSNSPGHVGELPPVGIRHPGPDGIWGDRVANGSLLERSPPLDGRVYGPYLELKEERLLASTSGAVDPETGELTVYMPGQGGYDPGAPKVIVDYWGKPIRFYRRPYAPGSLGSDYRNPAGASPSLADVVLLRPFDVAPGEAINGLVDDNPDIDGGDPTTTRSLKAAQFALFSSGPDRTFVPRIRYDEQEFNKDNIVELGP